MWTSFVPLLKYGIAKWVVAYAQIFCVCLRGVVFIVNTASTITASGVHPSGSCSVSTGTLLYRSLSFFVHAAFEPFLVLPSQSARVLGRSIVLETNRRTPVLLHQANLRKQLVICFCSFSFCEILLFPILAGAIVKSLCFLTIALEELGC